MFTVEEGSDHEETVCLILQLENAVSEVVQNDGELCALYSSYQDARKQWSEKVRLRGFWKVKSSEKGIRQKGSTVPKVAVAPNSRWPVPGVFEERSLEK